MFVFSTGQIGSPLLSLNSIRIDLRNKTLETQIVRVFVFDTTTSPKTTEFDETFSILPSSGNFRTITPTTFPDQYEVVVRSNTLSIVPYITGITSTGTVDPNTTFKYGDLFVKEFQGTVS
ncbi:MAG: hypothetical protein ACQEWV_15520 [Bacillota bacterium]